MTADSDTATFLSPVTADAPSWPRFALGTPQSSWTYRDAHGEIMFHILRWPEKGGGKTIMPLTLWRRANGKQEWKLKAPPAPRPLYGLQHLAARPHAPVLIVEGEKSADAAAKHFPDRVVVTSPGGAQAAKHADWSPLRARTVAIWPDNDDAGATYARDAAQLALAAGAAEVRRIHVPEIFPPGWDLGDAIPPHIHFDAVRRLIAEAEPVTLKVDLEAEIVKLAGLKRLAYHLARTEAAAKLGLTVKDLDGLVSAQRRDDAAQARAGAPGKDDALQGSEFVFEPVEPWSDPVDGDDLLDRIAARFKRHLALPDHADHAMALWVLHTWLFQSSFITPRLALISPVKRCGKTTALRIVANLVPRTLLCSNTTTAAMFRIIETDRPTLLLDEADTFIERNEDMRGLINAGHARDGSFVRVVGDKHVVRRFSCWCPMAIAAIRVLPGTIEDRSIKVSMRRALKGEVTQSFRPSREPAEFDELKAMAARWAADNEDVLADAEPEMPASLHDRACDNWRPLIAIADLAGGEWPLRARNAAIGLSGESEKQTLSVELLTDIRAAFDGAGTDRMSSADLVAKLTTDPERPWATLDHGKPMNQRMLAKRLEPFALAPVMMRMPQGPGVRGYQRAHFADVFARYLPAPDSNPQQAQQR